ncbi:hypothetical protein [Anaeromusa sp.]|uniref:hypothetical protein n=1 Tax=Anaeromusa sp. TaxID=1872520 RepID=UPI0026068361|nr:hypothetical protein [Anaeromusa sp.]MDD3158970.1 hypothetical protein [Anaeromusa sp.]
MKQKQSVELHIPLQEEMLPVIVSCTENTAQAFGFGKEEQLSLSLATEELFAFLSGQREDAGEMHFCCRHGGYYLEASCLFPRRALPTKVFNRTASMSLDDDAALAEMGLLLAARTVDHFCLEMLSDNRMGLQLRLEKRYPQAAPEEFEELPSLGFALAEPEREALKQFSRRVLAVYGDSAPEFFHYPGKLVDMLASGEYGAVLMQDSKGQVGGGFLWQYGGKMVEAFGPYVFSEQAGLAVTLVEGALNKLARSGIVCMTMRQPTAQAPAGYFEPLGEVVLASVGGVVRRHTALYRQLEEDNGMSVFAHPMIEAFLRQQYDFLALPRKLQPAIYEGEEQLADSILSTRLDRRKLTAFLAVLAPGADMKENLAMHVTALRNENIKNIFFELDLGKAAEVEAAPAILAAGFTPQFILPWGGRGDLLLLTLPEEA